MNPGHFNQTGFPGKILTAFLITMAVFGLALGTGVGPYTAPDEWDEVLDTARAVLAKIPDAGRIEATIKDPALRAAVLRACRDLKACAKVNRDQSPAVKQGTLAEFERAFKSVQTEAERSEYNICAAKCRTEGVKCEQDCASAKKKLCSCKLTEFGSFVTRCLFG